MLGDAEEINRNKERWGTSELFGQVKKARNKQ